MPIFDFIDGLLHTKSEQPTLITIPRDHLLDSPSEGSSDSLTPQESYFEIRLKQVYLRYERDLWRNFKPLTACLCSFLHNGEQVQLPIVVGPDLLEKALKLADGKNVAYFNSRVAGPFPYEGGDVRLFMGLVRVQSADWAQRTLSLVETFAQAFDLSKITSYISIANPMVNAVESIMGMSDVELRMGVMRDYQLTQQGAINANSLTARYELLLNLPSTQLSSAEQARFWVKDGQLYVGENAQTLRPYRDSDFILYQIQPLTQRQDYTTFKFHKEYWIETKKAIWDDNVESATRKFKSLMGELASCADLVQPHRIFLMKRYKKQFEEEKLFHQQIVGIPKGVEGELSPSFDIIIEKGIEPDRDLESDLFKAVQKGIDSAEYDQIRTLSAEKYLDQLGL